jgi:hypothetical protein
MVYIGGLSYGGVWETMKAFGKAAILTLFWIAFKTWNSIQFFEEAALSPSLPQTNNEDDSYGHKLGVYSFQLFSWVHA